MKNFFDGLTGYRFKVERDGREIVNIPGILALPGLFVAPKMGMIGMIAAPLFGCNIHLENANGKEVDVGRKVQEAAETIVDTAKKTVRTIEDEINKAWDSVSADDPEGCPEGEENEDEPRDDAAENTTENTAEDVPTIEVKPGPNADS